MSEVMRERPGLSNAEFAAWLVATLAATAAQAVFFSGLPKLGELWTQPANNAFIQASISLCPSTRFKDPSFVTVAWIFQTVMTCSFPLALHAKPDVPWRRAASGALGAIKGSSILYCLSKTLVICWPPQCIRIQGKRNIVFHHRGQCSDDVLKTVRVSTKTRPNHQGTNAFQLLLIDC